MGMTTDEALHNQESFYCPTLEQRVLPRQCLSRRSNGYVRECTRCTDYDQIREGKYVLKQNYRPPLSDEEKEKTIEALVESNLVQNQACKIIGVKPAALNYRLRTYPALMREAEQRHKRRQEVKDPEPEASNEVEKSDIGADVNHNALSDQMNSAKPDEKYSKNIPDKEEPTFAEILDRLKQRKQENQSRYKITIELYGNDPRDLERIVKSIQEMNA